MKKSAKIQENFVNASKAKYLSLGFKFIFLIIVILTVTMGATTYFVVRKFNQIQLENLQTQGQELGRFVSLISPEPIFNYDFDTLNDYMKETSHRQDVVYAVLLSPEGAAMTSYLNEENPYVKKYKQDNILQTLSLLEKDSGIIPMEFPVKFEAEVIGVVHLGVSDHRIKEIARNTMYNLGFANVGIIFILNLAIFLVFRLNILVPIRRLMDGSDRLAEGDLSVSMDGFARDEFGRLANSFEHMRNAIKEHQDHLEELVDQRTIQLKEAVEGLEASQKVLEQKNATVNLLGDVAIAANKADSFDQVIRMVLEYVHHYTKYSVGHCYVVSKEDPRLLQSANVWFCEKGKEVSSFQEETARTELRSGEGLPGRVLEKREVVWIPDISEEGNYPRMRGAKEAGFCGAFAFPVIVGEEVTAVLEFYSFQKVAEGEVSLDVVKQIGTQLGRVVERKRSQEEREVLNKKIVDTAHQAGKAEVATGVLHNVGNVLNSLVVNTGVLKDRIDNSQISYLGKLNALVQTHVDDLGHFVTETEQGKKLPPFLDGLSKGLIEERTETLSQIEEMTAHIQHISDIVRLQQSYSKVAGVSELVSIDGVINDSIQMIAAAIGRHNIELQFKPSNLPKGVLDRHKTLQILINLIGNAKHAVQNVHKEHKKIEILVEKLENDFIRIEVADNGLGIAEENLSKIFSHGFTTKKKGHGFGLHSSVLFAKEMGGDLTCFSAGVNQGTKFTLELPFKTGGGHE